MAYKSINGGLYMLKDILSHICQALAAERKFLKSVRAREAERGGVLEGQRRQRRLIEAGAATATGAGGAARGGAVDVGAAAAAAAGGAAAAAGGEGAGGGGLGHGGVSGMAWQILLATS